MGKLHVKRGSRACKKKACIKNVCGERELSHEKRKKFLQKKITWLEKSDFVSPKRLCRIACACLTSSGTTFSLADRAR